MSARKLCVFLSPLLSSPLLAVQRRLGLSRSGGSFNTSQYVDSLCLNVFVSVWVGSIEKFEFRYQNFKSRFSSVQFAHWWLDNILLKELRTCRTSSNYPRSSAVENAPSIYWLFYFSKRRKNRIHFYPTSYRLRQKLLIKLHTWIVFSWTPHPKRFFPSPFPGKQRCCVFKRK